jgi:recombination protein RecR
MYSPSIQKLTEEFSKLPGVGPRTAARYVFFLKNGDKAKAEELARAILALKENVKTCRLCFNVFESQKEICEICANASRDKSALCVVANETDLAALEKLGIYNGLYFVLGGAVSGIKKEIDKKLRVKELELHINNNKALKEVILAINPTAEGLATILFLQRLLKPYSLKISKLGCGLPVGGELEYADEETLASAITGRKQA